MREVTPERLSSKNLDDRDQSMSSAMTNKRSGGGSDDNKRSRKERSGKSSDKKEQSSASSSSSPSSSERRKRKVRRRSSRDISPDPQKRLVMCGAVDISRELTGSIQDVRVSVRQIVSSVRNFGPEEKEYVFDTLKDMGRDMRRKVRAATANAYACAEQPTPQRESKVNFSNGSDPHLFP